MIPDAQMLLDAAVDDDARAKLQLCFDNPDFRALVFKDLTALFRNEYGHTLEGAEYLAVRVLRLLTVEPTQ